MTQNDQDKLDLNKIFELMKEDPKSLYTMVPNNLLMRLIEILNKRKEVCVCAAIKFQKLDEEVIIRGHRHSDCFLNVSNRPDSQLYNEIEQGFMTTRNRFVDREEGLWLQLAAGIPSVDPDGYRKRELFSEDLY